MNRRFAVISVLCLAVILVLALFLVFPVAHSPASTSVEGWGRTLFLESSNGTNLTLPIVGLGSGGRIVSESLSFLTPPDALQGPAGLSAVIQGSSFGWNWGNGFGYSSLGDGQTSSSLVANNSTKTSTISFPPVGGLGGSAKVQSLNSDLTGNYSLSLDVAGKSVFNRSGARGFLPFSSLAWAQGTTTLTSAAFGEASNGSNLLVLGDTAGDIDVLSGTPGLVGRSIYEAQLFGGEPVSDIFEIPPTPANPSSTFVATDWGFVYILSLSDTGAVSSVGIQTWTGSSGIESPVVGMGAILRGGNLSSIVYLDSEGNLQVANSTVSSSTQKWPSIMSRLGLVGSGVTAFGVDQNVPGGPALLIGRAGELQVFNLSGGSLTSEQLDPVQSCGDPTAITPLSPVDLVGIGCSNGEVQTMSLLTSSEGSLGPVSGGGAVVDMASESLHGSDLLVVGASPNVVSIFKDAGSPSPHGVSLGEVPSGAALFTVGFADVSGAVGGDVIAANAGGLWDAVSEESFNASGVQTWASSLQQAIPSSSQSTDAWGNIWNHASVSLSVQGGAASVTNAILTYNYTREISLPTSVESISVKSSEASGGLTLSIEANTSGLIHVEFSYGVLPPPVRGWWTPLEQAYLSPWLALGLAVSGGALVALGILRYRAGPRIPPASTTVNDLPRRGGR